MIVAMMTFMMTTIMAWRRCKNDFEMNAAISPFL